ncbi:MAG: polyphosphate polymerase domain-containing protein, partial [Anaerolineales bacterium]|nr:polyphosphate polymerase domain-containing protein [Anaerolineales bacterium]
MLRYELKFACPEIELPQIRSWFRLHPAGFKTAYAPRYVNNLYFDTADLDSFNANVAGIGQRAKLRLRWYGQPPFSALPQPVLELKYKQDMLGGKVQEQLATTVDLTVGWRGLYAVLRANTAVGQLQQALRVASQPTLLNQYRRDYLLSADGHIRATLDYDLRGYDQRLRPRLNHTRPLLGTPHMVIELKASEADAAELVQIADALPVRRSRNSKYV